MSQFFSVDKPSRTNGLSSAYQLTEVTGAGAGASVDTGGLLRVSGRPVPRFNPQMVIELIEIEIDNSRIDFVSDPAYVEFDGPLGMPATHAQLAQRFQVHQYVTADTYEDIPEGIL